MSYREKPRSNAKLSFRYEVKALVTGPIRQSADWASGGLISSVTDLSNFIRGVAEGLVFGNDTSEALRMMLDSPVPTGDSGVSYGLGMFIIDASDAGLGRIWGHDGWCNSFMYYCDDLEVAAVGTLNQLNNDFYPPTRKAIALAHNG